MIIQFRQSVLRREYPLPPSKSLVHRYLLAAAMAEGESLLEGLSTETLCGDLQATVGALKILGAQIYDGEDGIHVAGIDFKHGKQRAAVIDCGESATTLRFLIPSLLLGGGDYRLVRRNSLAKRPAAVLTEIFAEKDVYIARAGDDLCVSGTLSGGDFSFPADVSSQFASGLLFALPLTNKGGRIFLEEKIVSRPYIEMTRSVLALAGVTTEWESENVLRVPGQQKFTPIRVAVEQDASAKAYLDALLDFAGLKPSRNGTSLQGDAIFHEIISEMKDGRLIFDLSDTPDLAPMLFAYAGTLGRPTVFFGTQRLRTKESDRIETMRQELGKFGILFDVQKDAVAVKPPRKLRTPDEVLDGHNDHRVAMALAVLLTLTGGTLIGAESVCKSDPGFFNRLEYGGISLSLESK